MVTICINKSASYENLPIIKEILWDREWMVKKVDFIYNPSRGLPNESNPKRWPFKATFLIDDEEVIIRIYSLTAGYNGTGPHDLASILDYLGVTYSDEEIFTTRQMDYDGYIRLQYSI